LVFLGLPNLSSLAPLPSIEESLKPIRVPRHASDGRGLHQETVSKRRKATIAGGYIIIHGRDGSVVDPVVEKIKAKGQTLRQTATQLQYIRVLRPMMDIAALLVRLDWPLCL
jgi:hypothetical protein